MSRVFILTTQINFSSRTVANTPQTLKNQCQNIFQKFNKCKKLSTSSNFLQNFKHSPPVKPVKVKLPRRQNYQEILVEMIEAQKLQEEKELGAVEKPTSSTAPAGGAKTEGISQTNNETAAAPGRKIAQAFARIRSAEMSKREKKGLDFKGKDVLLRLRFSCKFYKVVVGESKNVYFYGRILRRICSTVQKERKGWPPSIKKLIKSWITYFSLNPRGRTVEAYQGWRSIWIPQDPRKLLSMDLHTLGKFFKESDLFLKKPWRSKLLKDTTQNRHTMTTL